MGVASPRDRSWQREFNVSEAPSARPGSCGSRHARRPPGRHGASPHTVRHRAVPRLPDLRLGRGGGREGGAPPRPRGLLLRLHRVDAHSAGAPLSRRGALGLGGCCSTWSRACSWPPHRGASKLSGVYAASRAGSAFGEPDGGVVYGASVGLGFSALEAAAITRAPMALPISTAARPTPPEAPSTSRVSPGCRLARCLSACIEVP